MKKQIQQSLFDLTPVQPQKNAGTGTQLQTLIVTIKKEWLDEIASGRKTTDYREIKKYWIDRLEGKHYDQVIFRNGYSTTCPFAIANITKIDKGPCPYELWDKEYYRIHFELLGVYCPKKRGK